MDREPQRQTESDPVRTGEREALAIRSKGIQSADGGKEGYTYDYAGNITSTRDANGGVITYRYNSLGKVCEITDQEGHSETFRYDREGRMTLHTDRNGNQVRASYNVDGNPVVETGTDSNGGNAVTRSWEYDTSGRVKKAVSGGFCYTYEYRTDGKLVKKSSSGRTLLSCTYFSNGSLASLTDASGKPVYYEYDWRGKLSGVKDENGNTLAQYTHTPGGKLKGIRHGNGMYTQYEYDTDGNIIHLRLERPDGIPLSDWQYEYDLNGNRTLKAGSFADMEDNLCNMVIRYRYDKMDRLTEETYDGEAVGYSYDLCGNRIKKVDKNGKEVYTYNVKNQLSSRKSEKSETYYRYDQQGNVLEATGTEGGTYYSYNAFNQQTKVQKSDGNSLESQYDAEYLRAGMVENGKVSGCVYYNGELLAELDQEQETAGRYILGYGVAAGWNRKDEGCYFYHLDEQNSTAYITGMEGGIENRYQYDAFGVIRDCQERFDNRILYTGQQYDPITEQYYLRARYYNPTVGRFLQEDVYRGDGLNLYAYCANNPVIYYDPSGYARGRRKNSATNTSPNIDYGSINEYGQRSGIIALVTPQMIGSGTDANHGINPPGWIDGKAISEGGAGQARSHLLAKNLGGSGDIESNLVTFLQNPTNNSKMKTFENKTVKYIKDTKNSVNYKVTPLYNGTDGQPYGVIMEAVSANGDDFNERVRIIENPQAEAQAQKQSQDKGTCSKET